MCALLEVSRAIGWHTSKARFEKKWSAASLSAPSARHPRLSRDTLRTSGGDVVARVCVPGRQPPVPHAAAHARYLPRYLRGCRPGGGQGGQGLREQGVQTDGVEEDPRHVSGARTRGRGHRGDYVPGRVRNGAQRADQRRRRADHQQRQDGGRREEGGGRAKIDKSEHRDD